MIKVPRVDEEDPDEDIRARFNRIRESDERDFTHISQRLRGCKVANTVIDMGSVAGHVIERRDLFPDLPDLPVTVKPFIEHQVTLYRRLAQLLANPIKAELEHHDTGPGLPKLSVWTELCLLIARALTVIHDRRVVHADLHPGNIFIDKNLSFETEGLGDRLEAITLIDFGESFEAMPGHHARERWPNAYVAPERVGTRCPLNEQVDVYAFGTLMLYLATGRGEDFRASRTTRDRRLDIEKLFKQAFEQRMADRTIGDPAKCVYRSLRAIDLIGSCVARDPAERPYLVDVQNDLLDILAGETRVHRVSAVAPARRDELANHVVQAVVELFEPLGLLNPLSAALATRQRQAVDEGKVIPAAALPSLDPVLTRLLEDEIRRLRHIYHGAPTEMLDIRGSRDRILRVLRFLVDSLEQGDSWTAATSISMWQHNALGLNGSYASANIEAVKRGAAIRRTFVISVEELGHPFVKALSSTLIASDDAALTRLGRLFRHAANAYAGPRAGVATEEQRKLRERLGHIVDALERFARWIDADLSKVPWHPDGTRVNVEGAGGLFFGIRPVSDRDEAGKLREENPAALMHLGRRGERDQARWLLVTTEVRGRPGGGASNQAAAGEDLDAPVDTQKLRDEVASADVPRFEWPQLYGIRVYESLLRGDGQSTPLGRHPRDRIACFKKLMDPLATVSVGPSIDRLREAFRAAEKLVSAQG